MEKIKNKKLIWKVSSIVMLSFFVSRIALADEITPENIIRLVNQSREKEGLHVLIENKTLDKIAEDKASDMLKNNYFAHNSPSGLSPWYWFEKDKYDYKYAGENLAISFKTAEAEHKAWMDSPTHKKNILNPHYQEIGVAVVHGEINNQKTILAVQEFGMQMTAFDDSDSQKEFNYEQKKSDLINKEVELAPQVLSIKEENAPEELPSDLVGVNPLENKNEAGIWKKIAEGFNNNKLAIANSLDLLAFMLFAVSLFMIPMAILAVVTNDIMAILEKARCEKRKVTQGEYYDLIRKTAKARRIIGYTD